MRQYLTPRKTLVFTVALLIAGLVYLLFHPSKVPTISGEFIPYDHLATEKTDPFLVGGTPPVSGSKAVVLAEQYDDVRDCLMRSEHDAEFPDLRKFAWHKMRSYDVADVCIFRAFSSFGTPERARMWLVSQGLKVKVSTTNRDMIVSATNLLEMDNSRLIGGSGLSGQIFMFFASRAGHRERISSWWSPEGRLIGTSISYISL